MIRSVHHADLISSAQITFDYYSQVCPGSQRLGKAARKHLVAHPNSKPPARHPRFGYFKNGGTDFPALADERIVHLDPLRREVFPKSAVLERSADLLFPPSYVFHSVSVDRFIGAAVCLAIRLVVSFQIYASGRNTAGDRRFPDGTFGRAAIVFKRADLADVD